MHKAVFFLDGGGAVAGNFDGIKQRSFGIEIKMTGLIRCQAAKEISELFGTQPEYMAEDDKYTIPDRDGKEWCIYTRESRDISWFSSYSV